MKLLASSNSLERILEIINEYYYSKSIYLKQISPNLWEIYNSRGKIESVNIVLNKNRYRFELKTEKKNSSDLNPKQQWEKLIAPHKPKETDNDEYVIDHNSSGIYTPVLEGIAKLNPSKFRTNHYITVASNLEKQGDQAFNSNQFEFALRCYTKAFITSLVGTHIDYLSKAKLSEKIEPKSKIVEKLYKLHDYTLIYSMIRQSNKRFQLKKLLLDRGMSNLVIKIEKEFNLYYPQIKEETSPSQAKIKNKGADL